MPLCYNMKKRARGKGMQTRLYMMRETSPYLLGMVVVTERDRCIVVDGGRPEDLPLLKELVGGRRIGAWLLTHPHVDHISGLVSELERNGGADFAIERVICRFPDYGEWLTCADAAPDRAYFLEELNEMLPAWNRVKGTLGDRLHEAVQGERFVVDECDFEVLYTTHAGLLSNPMNDSSMVVRMQTPRRSVLFLGDLGPEGGDVLFFESRHKLKSDVVQMAHHGHMNVGFEVYEAISPEVCLWNAPQWVYDEPEVPSYLSDREKLVRMKRIRMYGSALTRRWMDVLGVKEHYVSYTGTKEILL